MHSPSRVTFESSEHLLEGAIAREPQYAAALAWLAHWHVMRVGQGWSPDEAHDARRAQILATQAVECDEAEPMALAGLRHVHAFFFKGFYFAPGWFYKAVWINPHAPPAMALS